MTAKEAAARIEDHMAAHKIGEYPHLKLAEALNMALAALRAQVEAEANEPLTVDELRGMARKPVYIVLLTENQSWWIVIRGVTKEKLTTDYGGWFALESYGKTWLAYRRKPKETTT